MKTLKLAMMCVAVMLTGCVEDGMTTEYYESGTPTQYVITNPSNNYHNQTPPPGWYYQHGYPRTQQEAKPPGWYYQHGYPRPMVPNHGYTPPPKPSDDTNYTITNPDRDFHNRTPPPGWYYQHGY